MCLHCACVPTVTVIVVCVVIADVDIVVAYFPACVRLPHFMSKYIQCTSLKNENRVQNLEKTREMYKREAF